MKLSKRQKAIIYGLALGDGYLQKTGRFNARVRLEHSEKQREYVWWLRERLATVFASKPTRLSRIHPKTGKTYYYLRLQSNSSPWLGKLRVQFYDLSGKKRVPQQISSFLSSPLSLAVWYMDDGYYYARDKSAHFYLPQYPEADARRLIGALQANFSLAPSLYCRPDRRSCQLTLTGDNLRRLTKIINPYLIPSMRYKLPLTP